ncbi:hypothetical protein R3P38DRAFT_2882054 [Favolaschia claudopus]|uniref:DUF6534 domain-containing protein n=1 Tax=Favolaschia claudopus TaxID=2862362 RepID=A0AAW0D2Z9_9AGAR
MFFNFALMGSLLVQVYNYYQAFPKDRISTKCIVYILFVLELAQTIIMTYFAYTIFGAGFGNVETFDRSALEWFPVCILGSIVAGIVQIFYAWRLRSFSGSWIAGGIVAALALIQVGSGIGQGVISKRLVDRSNLTGKPIVVTLWLVSTAVCDVFIAGFMTFYLTRGQIQSVRMKNTITKVVRYTVETGAITALVAIIQIVIQHASPKNNYFETPSWTLGKLYSNNLLVLLNSRAVTIGGRDYTQSTVRGITDEINFHENLNRTTDTQLDERRRSDIRSEHMSVNETSSIKEHRKYPSSRTLGMDDVRV